MSENQIDIQRTKWHPFNSEKVLIHGDRIEAIINERYLPPVVLNLDVTGRCQYRCSHCHHRNKQVMDRQLPDLNDRLARTIPYFLRTWTVNGFGVRACCIVGSQGDALLYPGLPKLLKELHYSGIDIGLVTNGYGFTNSLLYHAAFYAKFVGFSMDAGSWQTYEKIKHCPKNAWTQVNGHIQKLTSIINEYGLRNDVGWKMLILPDNQNEIYQSCEIARDRGCRYVQIRPADLPETDRQRIDVDVVEAQIRRAVNDLEQPGAFEIVGVRHKFTNEYKKILPEYCYLTPLTVTVTSDGKAYACVDRRCDESTMIADCGKYGWSALSESWGSARHVSIVHDVINRCGDGPDCDIRCSNYGYDKFFQAYYLDDLMDRELI